MRKERRHREPFEDRVTILFEELELAIKWQRPSVLLAVYGSEFLRAKAEATLKYRLLELGQSVYQLEVNEELFDIPLVLSQHPERDKSVFFITGLRWGGGSDGYNAYKALNLRREYFVNSRIRVVFWLTESEAFNLPHHAPDFWAFRHRVVEFIESPAPKRLVSLAEGSAWHSWKPYILHEEIDTEIALRERLLADLPHKNESQAARADLFYALASLYWAKGEHKKAIAFLKQGLAIAQVLQDSAMKSRFWVGLGFVFHDLRHMDEAISAYQKAIELNPRDAISWSNLSNVYRDLGRAKDAIEACHKAIKLDPRDAGPWNNLGNIYFDQGRTEDAISAYQKAIELDPKDTRPWNNLGNVYRDQGRTEDAIRAYQKAIQFNPKDAGPWNNLGSIYRNLDRTKDAISAYKKVISLNPKDARPWNNLGQIYRLLDRIPRAVIAYKNAIALDPNDATVYSSLAACYRKSGHEAEAEEQFKIARPLMKMENEYNRACFESICGNVDKALKLLKIALKKKQTSLAWVRREPNFDFIREDSRFKTLVGEG